MQYLARNIWYNAFCQVLICDKCKDNNYLYATWYRYYIENVKKYTIRKIKRISGILVIQNILSIKNIQDKLSNIVCHNWLKLFYYSFTIS